MNLGDANGRSDWIGWFELKREAVDEKATENTGRVIDAVKADVLCMVEVEDRVAVNRFNSSVIPKVNGVSDGRPGTYGDGTANDKIDYILMSPKLLPRVLGGGIERRGVWGGKNGTLFPHFPEIQTKINAASDHAALWVYSATILEFKCKLIKIN